MLSSLTIFFVFLQQTLKIIQDIFFFFYSKILLPFKRNSIQQEEKPIYITCQNTNIVKCIMEDIHRWRVNLLIFKLDCKVLFVFFVVRLLQLSTFLPSVMNLKANTNKLQKHINHDQMQTSIIKAL